MRSLLSKPTLRSNPFVRSINGLFANDAGAMELTMEALGLHMSFPLAAGQAAPSFSRPDDYVVLSQADSGLSSIYWPFVVDMEGKVDDPPDRWALYYSTDHDSGAGGIGVAFGPTPMGPFTKYQNGAIYANTTDGNQVETPVVIWNEDEQKFFLYYHVNSTPQQTCLATSVDGIHWTRVGIVLRPITTLNHGSHSGYFKPFRYGRSWLGYGLCKGSDWSVAAISYSKDGRYWRMDARPFWGEAQWHGENDAKFHFGNAIPFVWRGELWTFISYGEFGSGGETTVPRFTYIAPLAANGRSLRGRPLPVVTELAEDETMLDAVSCIIEHAGVLYAYTRRNDNDGDIIVFTGVA